MKSGGPRVAPRPAAGNPQRPGSSSCIDELGTRVHEIGLTLRLSKGEARKNRERCPTRFFCYMLGPVMWIDVVDLRDFYASSLGQVARRMIRRQLRTLWPNVTGES